MCLETNPWYWKSQNQGLDKCLRQILIFINAHVSLSKQNRVVVLAMHSEGQCHHLYESDNSSNDSTSDPIQNDVSGKILKALSELDADSTPPRKQKNVTTTTPLACALSMSMCYANRVDMCSGQNTSTRVVVIQGSGDFAGQYVPVMNAIFSAQRSEIPIDSCILGNESDSAFLQQAAHITGGLYYKVSALSELTQSLMQMSSADVGLRKMLQVPNQRGVDFRASCFCHKAPLETGFVCSVCLSIYCKECKRCQTCEAEFDA
ncbi:general transcription and DNA repair factor IIH subunit TFB4 [bacterium]|nr:general transcription and DNA repair factor IIH subunit TFB4 [bacterium]